MPNRSECTSGAAQRRARGIIQIRARNGRACAQISSDRARPRQRRLYRLCQRPSRSRGFRPLRPMSWVTSAREVFPVLVDDMARSDAKAARDADKGKPLVLLGHSMGVVCRAALFCSIIANCWTVVALSGDNRARSAGRRGKWRVAGSSRISMHLSRPRANPVRLAEPRQGRCRRLHRRSAVRISTSNAEVVWVAVRPSRPGSRPSRRLAGYATICRCFCSWVISIR